MRPAGLFCRCGNAERQIAEIAHRVAAGESVRDITDVRGTAFKRKATPGGWTEIDSTHLDTPGRLNPPEDPYAMGGGSGAPTAQGAPDEGVQVVRFVREVPAADRATSVIRLPSFEQVRDDVRVLYSEDVFPVYYFCSEAQSGLRPGNALEMDNAPTLQLYAELWMVCVWGVVYVFFNGHAWVGLGVTSASVCAAYTLTAHLKRQPRKMMQGAAASLVEGSAQWRRVVATAQQAAYAAQCKGAAKRALSRAEEPWFGKTWPVGDMRKLWELAHPRAYAEPVER